MPLITTQQFPGLVPTAAQDIIGSLQAGQQFQARRGALQQQAKEQQIRQTLGQIGQQQPLTEQQQMLQAQGAELGETQSQVIPEEQLIQQARQIDPVIAEQTLKQLGMDKPSRRAEASRTASQLLAVPPEQRPAIINQRVQELQAQGRDPSDTLELLDMNPQEQEAALRGIQLADLSTQQRMAFDIKKSDLQLKRQTNELKKLEAQQKRETNALKRQELEQKIADKQREQQSLVAEKTSQAQSEIDTMGDTIETIDRLLANPELESAIGIQGALPDSFFTGRPAAAVRATLETLKSQSFLSQVEKMSGMGALSDVEGRKLASALGALDTKMPDEDFIKELTRIRKLLLRNRKTLAGGIEKDPNIKFGDINIKDIDELSPRERAEADRLAAQQKSQKIGRFTVEAL